MPAGRRDRQLIEIERLAERLGAALAAGDAGAMARYWGKPCMIVEDHATKMLTTGEQIEKHCSELLAKLAARGPAAALLHIDRMDLLSPSLAAVDFSWSAPGELHAREVTHCIIQGFGQGEARICVSVAVGVRLLLGGVDVVDVVPDTVQDEELSAGLADTFPGSDPVAISTPGVRVGSPMRRRTGRCQSR